MGENYLEFTIESPKEVWKYIKPIQIIVHKWPDDNVVYVQILADCDWEEEHGLQLVYKNGNQLSRVSEQDGHLTHSDEFNLSNSEDRIYG